MAAKKQKKKHTGRGKKKKTEGLALKLGIGMAAVIVVLGGVLTAMFAYNSAKYKDHFLPGTVINGTDCGNMTVEEAEAALSQQAAQYQLEVIPKSGQTGVVLGTDIGYSYTSDGTPARVMEEQDGSAWFGNHGEKAFSLEEGITYDSEKLKTVVESFAFLQEMIQPQNARVGYQEGAFLIVPEQEGEAVDPQELYEAVLEAVAEGQTQLKLEETDLYLSPEITSDSEELAQRKAELEELVSASITYDLP